MFVGVFLVFVYFARLAINLQEVNNPTPGFKKKEFIVLLPSSDPVFIYTTG